MAPENEEEEGGNLGTIIAFVVVLAVLLGAGAYFLKGLSNAGPPPVPQEQTISVVVPPPPPPPPPPPKDEPPPPEPEQMEEPELPDPEPEPEAIQEADSDEPPPDPGADVSTGIEGAGGGMSIGGGGGGRGGGGDPRAYWAGQLARDLQRLLDDSDEFRRRSYNMQLKIWFNDDGTLEALDILKGSGDATFDARLKKYLMATYRRPNVPPAAMQPVTMRIRAEI